LSQLILPDSARVRTLLVNRKTNEYKKEELEDLEKGQDKEERRT
jgi:hypothetical protein